MESGSFSSETNTRRDSTEVALHSGPCPIECGYGWTGGMAYLSGSNIQQIINRIGTLKPKVFGIIDFTAGYHQTPLHPDSQEFSTVYSNGTEQPWASKGQVPSFNVVWLIMCYKGMAHAYVRYSSTVYCYLALTTTSIQTILAKSCLREGQVTANPETIE